VDAYLMKMVVWVWWWFCWTR